MAEGLDEELNPKEDFKFKKRVRIQYDGRQYSIRIPMKVVEALNIKKGQEFIFDVNPTGKETICHFILSERIGENAKKKKT